MNTAAIARLAAALLGPLAALALTTSADAAATNVAASVDAITDSQSKTDGSLASASAAAPGGAGSVEADLTRIHIYGSDTTHFSVGAPGSSGASDFYFELQGTSALVDLDFNFLTTGGFFRDETTSYTSNGGFGAYLQSAAGPSPYMAGSLNIVQCIGCGGRLGGGSITTFEDYLGPGAVTTVPWEGVSPGAFAFHSTFLGGQASGGRLQLSALGGGGNSNYDFQLALRSVTVHGNADGLTLYVPSTGQQFVITSSGAGSGAPEPASWALMIVGFGLVGGALRRRPRFA